MPKCACGKHDDIMWPKGIGFAEFDRARTVHFEKRCGSMRDPEFRRWFMFRNSRRPRGAKGR